MQGKMINKTANILLLLLLLPAAWQCTERIDVEVGSTYTRLVVEGAVTTDTTVHSVRLSLTSDYFYNQPAPPVSGASVFIDDGEQTAPGRPDWSPLGW